MGRSIILAFIIMTVITGIADYLIYDDSITRALFHAGLRAGAFWAVIVILMKRDEKKPISFDEWRLREAKKAAALWDDVEP